MQNRRKLEPGLHKDVRGFIRPLLLEGKVCHVYGPTSNNTSGNPIPTCQYTRVSGQKKQTSVHVRVHILYDTLLGKAKLF